MRSRASSDTDSDDESSASDAAFEQLWDFFEAAEQPGALLEQPLSDSVPLGMGFGALEDLIGSNGSLGPAVGLNPPSNRQGSAHGFTISEEMLECEDAEWSAIEGFMNQVRPYTQHQRFRFSRCISLVTPKIICVCYENYHLQDGSISSFFCIFQTTSLPSTCASAILCLRFSLGAI